MCSLSVSEIASPIKPSVSCRRAVLYGIVDIDFSIERHLINVTAEIKSLIEHLKI